MRKMKKPSLVFTLITFSMLAVAQMPTVQLNQKKMQFDDGKDLPAEKAFVITTEASAIQSMVKMQLSSTGFEKNNILYESQWNRKENDKGSIAVLPNHYKLRSGKNYFFRFLYYRKIDDTERRQVTAMLQQTANALLTTNILMQDDRYRFVNSPSDVFAALNGIVEDGMKNYETNSGTVSPTFSGVIENMLQTMTKIKRVDDSVITSINYKGELLHQINQIAFNKRK